MSRLRRLALSVLVMVAVVIPTIAPAVTTAAQDGDQTAGVTLVSADASHFPTVDVLISGPRSVNLEAINLEHDGIEVPARLVDARQPPAAVLIAVDPDVDETTTFDALEALLAELPPDMAVGIVTGHIEQQPTRDRAALVRGLALRRNPEAQENEPQEEAEGPQVAAPEPETFEHVMDFSARLLAGYEADSEVVRDLVVLIADGRELGGTPTERSSETSTTVVTASRLEAATVSAAIAARSHPTAVVRLAFPEELVERYGARTLVAALVGADKVAETRLDDSPFMAAPPAPLDDPSTRPTAAPLSNPEAVVELRGSGSGLRIAGLVIVGAAIAVAVGSTMLLPGSSRHRRTSMQEVMYGAPGLGESKSSGLSEGIVAIADRLLGGSTRVALLGVHLQRAGIPMRPTEFVVIVTIATIAATLVGLSMFGSAAFIMAPATSIMIVVVVVRSMTSRRRDKFADQLPALLSSMSGSLRGGNSLLQVLTQASQDMSAPTSDELARVLAENRLGRDLAEALRASADRMDVDDYRWVVEAIDVNRQTGGDLTSVLDNVEETIRDRASIGRQVKALTAEGRISAKMISSLPFALFGWQYLMNPRMAGVLLNTSTGRMLGLGALGLMAIGALWMRQVSQLKY